jgi:hypothetical protein
MRVTALPPAQWRLMVTCDGAGASHALVKDLDRLAARHGCQGIYVVGWELGAREESLPGQRRAHHGHWTHVAHVGELTGLRREGPGGDQLKGWPKRCGTSRPRAASPGRAAVLSWSHLVPMVRGRSPAGASG